MLDDPYDEENNSLCATIYAAVGWIPQIGDQHSCPEYYLDTHI